MALGSVSSSGSAGRVVAPVPTAPSKNVSARGVDFTLRFEKGRAVLRWEGTDRNLIDFIWYQDRFVLHNMTTGQKVSSQSAQRFDQISVPAKAGDRLRLEVFGRSRPFEAEWREPIHFQDVG